MSALKTIRSASFCVRTVTTSTTTPKSKSSSLAFWNIKSRNIHEYGCCRITPCAHILSPAHDKPPPLQLGFVFRGRHRSSPLSSSCVEKSRTLDCGSGSSSRSGPASDMGSEMKHRDYLENDALLQKESRPTSYMVNSQKASNFLTVPTMLTLGRVAAVPLLVGTFYVDAWWGAAATTSIFIVAAVTDWLDGYIARKMKLKSTFGAFLDPVADKLMVAATLVLLCTRPLEVGVFGQVPWLLTIPAIAIIGREITMSAVREWAASQDSKLLEAVAVNNLGKWKTATQMTALTILLATRDSSLGGPTVLVGCGVVLLYTSAGLALWSLIVYVRNIGRFLLRKGRFLEILGSAVDDESPIESQPDNSNFLGKIQFASEV